MKDNVKTAVEAVVEHLVLEAAAERSRSWTPAALTSSLVYVGHLAGHLGGPGDQDTPDLDAILKVCHDSICSSACYVV